MNDSGLVSLRRFSTDEIVGTEGKAGLIERYFSLMPEGGEAAQPDKPAVVHDALELFAGFQELGRGFRCV